MQSDLPKASSIMIIDGDTLKGNFPTLPPVFGKDLEIRIRGIDTPEIHSDIPKVKWWALKAKEYLAKALQSCLTVTFKKPTRDKFFRIDADVYFDDLNIGPEMIRLKFAKPYNGGTKIPWTEQDIPNEPSTETPKQAP